MWSMYFDLFASPRLVHSMTNFCMDIHSWWIKVLKQIVIKLCNKYNSSIRKCNSITEVHIKEAITNLQIKTRSCRFVFQCCCKITNAVNLSVRLNSSKENEF